MTAFLAALQKVTGWVGAAMAKVTVKGALGAAWEWVTWAVMGFLRSLYNVFISPKVWPAVAVWGAVIAIFAYNVGQNHPEGGRVLTPTRVDTSALDVCRTRSAQQAVELEVARKVVNELNAKVATLESALAEKPKTVVRYRSRPAKKTQDSSFSINWPQF